MGKGLLPRMFTEHDEAWVRLCGFLLFWLPIGLSLHYVLRGGNPDHSGLAALATVVGLLSLAVPGLWLMLRAVWHGGRRASAAVVLLWLVGFVLTALITTLRRGESAFVIALVLYPWEGLVVRLARIALGILPDPASAQRA